MVKTNPVPGSARCAPSSRRAPVTSALKQSASGGKLRSTYSLISPETLSGYQTSGRRAPYSRSRGSRTADYSSERRSASKNSFEKTTRGTWGELAAIYFYG